MYLYPSRPSARPSSDVATPLDRCNPSFSPFFPISLVEQFDARCVRCQSRVPITMLSPLSILSVRHKPKKPKLTSSPSLFRPRVSFDTFERPAEFIKETSFTLNKKHKDYEYNKRSRTFLCGFDSHEYSDYALEWLIEELVDDGDEIVCLRVVEKDDSLAGKSSMEAGRYRSEAEKLMARIEEKNIENKAINLILEFAIGKVQSVIDDMVSYQTPSPPFVEQPKLTTESPFLVL